jgi:hypothetical protein
MNFGKNNQAQLRIYIDRHPPMRKIILILFFTFISLSILAQKEPFEGYIIYRYTYHDLDGNDISVKMLTEKDSVQHYYINKANYVTYNQNQVLSQLYNSGTNQYFYSRANKIYVLDAGKSTSPKPAFKKLKEEKVILGNKCSAIQKGEGTKKIIYYVSDNILIDPTPFQNHHLGNWSDFLKASKGKLALQINTFHEDYTQTMTAVLIQKMTLPDEAYNIDKLIGN